MMTMIRNRVKILGDGFRWISVDFGEFAISTLLVAGEDPLESRGIERIG